MDECDNASRVAEFMDRVLLDARLKRTMEIAPNSCTHCEDCGEKIPEARRIAEPGCTLCVDCKSDREKHARVCAR